jgi:hypothetical protein
MSDIESAMRDFYRVRGLIDGTEPRWKHEDAAFLCRQQGVDVWLSFPNYPNSGGSFYDVATRSSRYSPPT